MWDVTLDTLVGTNVAANWAARSLPRRAAATHRSQRPLWRWSQSRCTRAACRPCRWCVCWSSAAAAPSWTGWWSVWAAIETGSEGSAADVRRCCQGNLLRFRCRPRRGDKGSEMRKQSSDCHGPSCATVCQLHSHIDRSDRAANYWFILKSLVDWPYWSINDLLISGYFPWEPTFYIEKHERNTSFNPLI